MVTQSRKTLENRCKKLFGYGFSKSYIDNGEGGKVLGWIFDSGWADDVIGFTLLEVQEVMDIKEEEDSLKVDESWF